jgi:heme/copper-type cytochrome/quinol oxidase subunit 2
MMTERTSGQEVKALLTTEESPQAVTAERPPKSYKVSEVIFVILVVVVLIGIPSWILRYDEQRAIQAGEGTVLNVVARNDKGRTGEWLVHPAGNWKYGRDGASAAIQVRDGEMVTLRLTSIDVEHEFSLPAYDIKAKVEPGKVTTVRFVANKTGTFKYECANYCRKGHDKMAGRLIVLQTTAHMM